MAHEQVCALRGAIEILVAFAHVRHEHATDEKFGAAPGIEKLLHRLAEIAERIDRRAHRRERHAGLRDGIGIGIEGGDEWFVSAALHLARDGERGMEVSEGAEGGEENIHGQGVRAVLTAGVQTPWRRVVRFGARTKGWSSS
jgi:hypothetical protein